MQPAFTDPLAGYPQTTEARGGEEPIFTIRPRVLTPFRAKLADGCAAVLTGLLGAVCVVMFLFGKNTGLYEGLVLLAVFFAGRAVFAWTAREIFRRQTLIEMSADTIAVRTWLGWQRYSRLLEHRFALQFHDLAEQEYRDNDYKGRKAAANGKVIRQMPYYGSSFHVVLLYGGHRADLLTVFGQKDATAIIARLQYCDRCLNEALAMGGGIPKRPEDEWNDAPGGMGHG